MIQNSNPLIKSLAKSGLEGVEKKRQHWTNERLQIAMYLDPISLQKLKIINSPDVSLDKVYISVLNNAKL